LEYGELEAVWVFVHDDFHWQVEIDVFRRTAHELGGEARAFLEIHQNDDQRVLVTGKLRMMQHRVAADTPLTGSPDKIPFQRATCSAHGPRRMAQGLAVAAALYRQHALTGLLPPPRVVWSHYMRDPQGLLHVDTVCFVYHREE